MPPQFSPEAIEALLRARPVAVIGASADRAKYGNIVLRNLRARGWTVFAVNPRGGMIEGQPAYLTLDDCPQRPALAVVVTPPAVTMRILAGAARLGVRNIWLQPGAESDAVLAEAARLGLQPVHDACIMVLAAQHADPSGR